ncbi:MAG: DNA/RNA non-specific endonuclease [Brumimicrobium sp.]|nr:DNA/RNA non-specific endonuclease [Brumimicrobium sp.]
MRYLYFLIVCNIFLSCKTNHFHYGVASPNYQTQLIRHTCISISYNPDCRQAEWVVYSLRKEVLENAEITRTDRFIPDPLLPDSISAHDKDYYKSGYDRGHLAPAADMAGSLKCMQESFYYSNISPQLPGFNRGIWKKLEAQVRKWAVQYDSILVVTGPLLGIDENNRIKSSQVCIPKGFFKALLIYYEGKPYGIGFFVPHLSLSKDISEYRVSIDQLEKITGFDFFPSLKKKVQKRMESIVIPERWFTE